MITSAFARRALLAATVSTAASLPQSEAFADGPARSQTSNPSGKPTRSDSYEPGSVNGELQRLFNENGQEMPSMRSRDLPNAGNMQSHLVRPKAAAPPKQNAFQKFFGKITGRSKPATPPTTPPVPPTTREPVAAPPAGHSIADGRRPQTQPSSRPGTATPPAARRVTPNSPPESTQAANSGSPGFIGRLFGNRSAETDSLPATPATASSGAQTSVPSAPRTVAVKPVQLPATIPLDKPSANQSFVQPGAAPAFMNSASAAAARVAAAAESAAARIPEDPLESLDLDDTSDVLDLDAVARSATAEAAAAVASQSPAEAPLPIENPTPLAQSAETPSQPETQSEAPFVAENPFTGVGLNEFDPTLPAVSSDSVGTPEVSAEGSTVTAPSEPLQSVNTEQMRIAAEQAERRQQLERIQSRGDLTGFKGFCPVALRDQRQLVDAQPRIQSTFGLQTWTFSSDEARLAFEADPKRYAPAAGGADVVALATRQEEVPGRLDFALWYRGRLHLFSSRETMATFLENPQQFSVDDAE